MVRLCINYILIKNFMSTDNLSDVDLVEMLVGGLYIIYLFIYLFIFLIIYPYFHLIFYYQLVTYCRR